MIEAALKYAIGMTIESFVQRAIDGREWISQKFPHKLKEITRGGTVIIEYSMPRKSGGEPIISLGHFPLGEMLLTPKVWRSVGKTKGWTIGRTKPHTRKHPKTGKRIKVAGNSWKVHQRHFIDTINHFKI